jgi:thiamine biosynthesis lipoprotein
MTVLTAQAERTFQALGTDVRLIGPDAAALARAEDFVRSAHARLTRFDAGSELSRLNADPREVLPASLPLRRALSAALWAAERTGGLVDPTLLGPIARAGYNRTYTELPLVPLADALPLAPPRRPAQPGGGWRSVRSGHLVRRPRGVELDLGGTAKGWIADALAALVPNGVIDCGGDIRVTGATEVAVQHPLTGELVYTLPLRGGAVATSGLARRVWMTPGGPAHHLLDPATGDPAWTGLVAVTALAPSALEAEALTKAALLSGPLGARRWLRPFGGVLFHDDGEMEVLPA